MYLMFILCLFSTVMVTPALAAEAVGGGVATTEDNPTFSTPSKGQTDFVTSPGSLLGGDDMVVTTDDVDNWVNRKGADIIHILTNVVMVVSIIGFFVGVILVIMGALSDKRIMAGGLIAMLICCATFAVSTCGPQIVMAVAAWMKS